MEENYLVALLISFLFGFVLFKKEKAPTADIDDDKAGVRKTVPTTMQSSEVSGVDKYLQGKNGGADAKMTGVSLYLQEKEGLDSDEDIVADGSSVDKYLETKAKDFPVSSVSKYMARKKIQTQQETKENLSSVEKYLKSHH